MVRLFGFGVWQNILLTKKKQKVENIGKINKGLVPGKD